MGQEFEKALAEQFLLGVFQVVPVGCYLIHFVDRWYWMMAGSLAGAIDQVPTCRLSKHYDLSMVRLLPGSSFPQS